MILADTGFFVAIASPNDQFHHAAITALEAIDEPIAISKTERLAQPGKKSSNA